MLEYDLISMPGRNVLLSSGALDPLEMRPSRDTCRGFGETVCRPQVAWRLGQCCRRARPSWGEGESEPDRGQNGPVLFSRISESSERRWKRRPAGSFETQTAHENTFEVKSVFSRFPTVRCSVVCSGAVAARRTCVDYAAVGLLQPGSPDLWAFEEVQRATLIGASVVFCRPCWQVLSTPSGLEADVDMAAESSKCRALPCRLRDLPTALCYLVLLLAERAFQQQ